MENYATADELVQMETRIGKQIETGFSGVHARMSRFEDEVRPHIIEQAAELAVLKFRSEMAEKAANSATTHVQSAKRSTTMRASTVGGTVAGIVMIILEVLKALK